MIKIFLYAADKEQAKQAAQTLKSAGAEHVELLESLKLSTRQPKENRYLFICETPAEKLATLVQNELPEAQYAELLEQWYTTQTKILGAYQSHKKRAVLISTSTLGKNEGLIPCINNAWDLKLSRFEPSKEEAIQQAHPDTLLAYLVQNLIQQTPPLQQLAESITESASLEPEFYTEYEAIAAYRNIKKIKSSYRETIETTKSQLTQLKSLQEESELLLVQLHQVQEELERIYLEYQAYKESTEHERAELTAARDHHAHIAHEREQEIGRLHNEKAELIAARDHQAQVSHGREKEIDRLHQEKNKLSSSLEQQKEINQNLLEECELLLSQIHLVQDEQERNFLALQEAKYSEDKVKKSLEKLTQNYPEIFVFENIDAKSIDEKDSCLTWNIGGLVAPGISRNHLSFETFIENSVLGFRFQKNEKGKSGLIKWPSSFEDAQTLDIIPCGQGKNKIFRFKAIREISSTDWRLLNLLSQKLNEALPGRLDIVEAITKFKSGLSKIPDTFRFDKAYLKQEVANQDYENIWIELRNASFGKYNWPKFEFRLAVANVTKENWSSYPKLEIPLIEGKTKPFDTWFEESADDFGVKYEIRFDIGQQIVDANVFSKLNNVDRNLMLSIVSVLNVILKEMQSEGLGIRRSWDNWINLTDSMYSIILKASHKISKN